MKLSKLSAVALVCVICWTTGFGRADAAEIDWSQYLQSASVVAAIASAVSMVDKCSKKPLLIEELKPSADKRVLVFTCDSTEDEQASGIIHLQRFGNGPWLPDRFDFAG
ncbi:MAG: hypothetical protein HKN11_15890 [Rhizobiales bacterium]|nr:hypothetical protein [Hyphomicrobiales bacterium]